MCFHWYLFKYDFLNTLFASITETLVKCHELCLKKNGQKKSEEIIFTFSIISDYQDNYLLPKTSDHGDSWYSLFRMVNHGRN